MKIAGIKSANATLKHSQRIGIIERYHHKLKEIVIFNVAKDAPHWDRRVNLAMVAHNTRYHQPLRQKPSEKFHGRVPYNALDLKFSHPLQPPPGTADMKTLVDQLNQKNIANVDNNFGALSIQKIIWPENCRRHHWKKMSMFSCSNPNTTACQIKHISKLSTGPCHESPNTLKLHH